MSSSLLSYVNLLTIISTLNCKALEITRPDYAMSAIYTMCIVMALLNRWMLLPVHQIGVAKQRGKWLQLVAPFLQRKNKKNPKPRNSLISVALSLGCNVVCKQDTKLLQSQACHTEGYFSWYLIQLNVLKLHKWVHDGAWAPLSRTERRLHGALKQGP